MDRWILHRLQEVIRRVRDAYEQYQFHVVYYTLYNFCTVDLSSLYLDVLKDRLYTSKAASLARRSAQTAMKEILEAMVQLLAPHPHLHGGGGVAGPARLSRKGRERPSDAIPGGGRGAGSSRNWRRRGRRSSPSRGRRPRRSRRPARTRSLGHSLDAAVVVRRAGEAANAPGERTGRICGPC